MKRPFICLSVILATTIAAGCASPENTPAINRKESPPQQAPDTDAASLNHHAIQAIGKGRWNDAANDVRKAIAQNQSFAPAHNTLGRVYYHEDQLNEATLQFQIAAKLDTRRAEPLNNLGLVYEKVGQLNKAIGYYESALKLLPHNPQIVDNLARAKSRRGDHDARLRQLLKTIASNDSRPAWKRWAHHQLALIYDGANAGTQP